MEIDAQCEAKDRSITFCDCCEKPVPRDQISRCWMTGIETFACDDCRGINEEAA